MSARSRLHALRNAVPAVLPSLLLCDFGNLEREVDRLTKAGVRAFHLDVMDGNFVPNLTYGFPIVEALRRLTDLPLDVHLMIDRPEQYLKMFVEAGADVITVHVEALQAEPSTAVEAIQRLGVGAGLALNPDTPLDRLGDAIAICDLILVMSVPAGFGGQSFRANALDRLTQLRRVVRSDVLLEVDGGVNRDTIRRCAEAGAHLFVVGSGIFRSPDYSQAVRELTELGTVP